MATPAPQTDPLIAGMGAAQTPQQVAAATGQSAAVTPAPATTTIPGAAPGVQSGAQSPGQPGTTTNGVAAVEPSVMSSSNIDTTNQQNTQTVTKAAANPPGQSVGTEGFVRNADQSFAEAPAGAKQVTDASGNNYFTLNGMNYALGPLGGGGGETGPTTTDAQGRAVYADGSFAPAPAGAQQSANGMWYDSQGNAYGAAPGTSGANVTSDPATQAIYDQLTQLKGQMDATGAANIAAITASYTALIQEQTQTNAGAQANTYSLLARGGSLQTASSSGIIQGQISFGLTKISQLNAQEQSALVAAQQAMENGDMKVIDDQLTIVNNARTERQAAASKLNDTIVAATAQATKDNAISKLLTQGIVDPATILSTLQSQGYDNISAKDVADAITALDPWQSQVLDLMKSAGANNAPQSVIAAMGAAKTYADALKAGQGYLSTDTNVQQYNLYRTQQQAAGKPVAGFDAWMNAQAYNKAYSTASGTLSGQMNAGSNPNNSISDPTATSTQTANMIGGSILSATGLSIAAFNYLTQGVSALSRLSAGQRMMVMDEAQNYVNGKGVDVSTIQSQFKALNDVLASNVARENNASIKGNDVIQTAKQLIATISPADEKGMTAGGFFGLGSNALSVQNIADLALGKAVNNPYATTYGTDMGLLVNDLAGYLAAAQSNSPSGAANPTEQDITHAAQMVHDGMNAGSLDAFQQAIAANVTKIAGVSASAVTSTQQQIWTLLGAGSSFQSSQTQNSPQIKTEETAITSLNTFYNSSPEHAKMLDAIHTTYPNMSATDIANQLGL